MSGQIKQLERSHDTLKHLGDRCRRYRKKIRGLEMRVRNMRNISKWQKKVEAKRRVLIRDAEWMRDEAWRWVRCGLAETERQRRVMGHWASTYKDEKEMWRQDRARMKAMESVVNVARAMHDNNRGGPRFVGWEDALHRSIVELDAASSKPAKECLCARRYDAPFDIACSVSVNGDCPIHGMPVATTPTPERGSAEDRLGQAGEVVARTMWALEQEQEAHGQTTRQLEELREKVADAEGRLYHIGATRGDVYARAKTALSIYNHSVSEHVDLEEERDELQRKLGRAHRTLTRLGERLVADRNIIDGFRRDLVIQSARINKLEPVLEAARGLLGSVRSGMEHATWKAKLYEAVGEVDWSSALDEARGKGETRYLSGAGWCEQNCSRWDHATSDCIVIQGQHKHRDVRHCSDWAPHQEVPTGKPDVVQATLLRIPHDNLASPYEGYAEILDRLDELWIAVKALDGLAQLRAATEVAAMTFRFMHDCCGLPLPEDTSR